MRPTTHNSVLSLILVFSLAFNIAFVGIWFYSRLQPDRPGAEPRRTWEQVGLDREQQRRMEQSWRDLRRELAPLERRLAAERDRLFELMAEQEPDREAIRAAHRRMEAIQERIRANVLSHLEQTEEHLTPEQRRRLFQMMRSRAVRGRRGAPVPPRREPDRRHPERPEDPFEQQPVFPDSTEGVRE